MSIKKDFFAPLALGLGATRRAAVLLLVMLLTATTAWATTFSTINVGGTDYTLFTGFTATDGTAVGNAFVYGNMVDGDLSSSFHAFTSPAYVEFNSDELIIPNGYIFNTFNASSFKPTGWVLKAKANTGDDWTELDNLSGQSISGQEYTHSCNNEGNNAYKYFRFEASNNSNNIWLTEIRLYGSAELPADYHSVTIADAMSGLISCEANKARAGSTVTLTLSHLVDESTLSVNDGAVTTTDIGNRQYTFTMPDGDVNVTATARATYSVTLPANMEIVSTTNDADGNGKYIEGTVVTFKPSFPYTASNVSDGTNTLTADGDGNYSVTVSTADITVTATVERNSNIDLSQATEGYTAINGDVLTGATSHAVAVAAGAGITLSGATISDGIVCEGSATITLVGTNNVTASDLKAGIQVGGSGTTLTIRGDGSLTATGGSQHCAGIGLKNASENDVIGGDIVIEGGNITATGGGTSGWAAGIGTGVAIDNHTAQIGNITIKGGSVTAVGGGDAAGIGTGYEWSESHTIAGTVTIYDGIDMVDASSITGDVTYMHVENDTETNVTTTASTYFNITEDGDRRIIYPRDDTDYTVTIDDNITGGTVTASPTTAKRGTIVTLTITPDAGNRLQTLTVKDANNNDVAVANNCFLMPKDGASVTATFVQRTTSFNESTGVLTLSGNVNADEVKEYGFVLNSYGGIDEDSRVTSVVCEPGTVLPADCSELFMTFNKVVTIDLSNAGTANITNTSRMFGSNWLTTIYVNSAWSMANVTSSDYMFYNCYRLTGGNGTEWNDVKDTIYESNGGDREAAMAAAGSGTYAVIDKEEDDEGRHEGYLTFKKGTPAIITAPTANTLTYTGEAQALVTAGTTTFGTLLYSTDGTNYSEDISTATDAGTYTVYYKVDETEDWYAVTAQTVEVTIAQKAVTNEDITVTIPSQTWTGNELTPVITVNDGETVLTLDEDYTVTAPSGPIQDSGNYTYTITGQGNYAGSREATFTISLTLDPVDISVNAAGTEYTIHTAGGWNAFCDLLAASTKGYFSGKTVKLDADIAVSRMAGGHEFTGTFDGDDHTLTLAYGTADAPVDAQFIAPFVETAADDSNQPVFRNLTIDGTIYASNPQAADHYHVGGLIGHLFGDVTIEHCNSLVHITAPGGAGGFVGLCEHTAMFTDCFSSAVITSPGGNNSGFVGWSRASGHAISFDGCTFNGKLLQQDGNGSHNGGFIGWTGANKTVTFTNCLCAPATLASGETMASGNSATFARGWNATTTATNSYYTQTFGDAQGTKPIVTASKPSNIGDVGTAYNVSGITAYGNGLLYGSDYYCVNSQFGEIALAYSGSSLTATIDGTSTATVSIPEDVTVSSVTYNRAFTMGRPSTVMLPFSKDVNEISGGTFYTFGGVEKKNNKWEATMNEVTGSLTANTPYLFVPTGTSLTFTGGATLNTTGGGNCLASDTGGWEFHGTYTNKVWDEVVTHDYGFAALSGTSADDKTVEAGQFVRLTTGASAKPMRCYLSYVGVPNQARALTRGAAATEEELPQSITVRLVGSNGETTAIGTIDTKTGEMTFDSEAWYTLDGVRLSGKPTKKGLYINNGKKVVIK